MTWSRNRSATVVVVALVLATSLTLLTRSSTPLGATHRANSAQWTVTIHLARTTVAPGGVIAATFTLDNTTGHALPVSGCAGQEYVIVLGNAKAPNHVVEPADLCSGTIGPGVHVVSATIATTYDSCGGGDGSPACGNPPRLTDLPAGRYLTQILLPRGRTALPMPAPFTVVISR
jgi:hypothetical protein